MRNCILRSAHGDARNLSDVEVRNLAAAGRLQPDDQISADGGKTWRFGREESGFVPPAPLEHSQKRSSLLPLSVLAGIVVLMAVGWLFSFVVRTQSSNGGATPSALQPNAIEWYTKFANQGHAGSQFNLGVIYDVGDGVPKDTGKAIEWYTKAAEQGNTGAQFNLGVIYQIDVPKGTARAVHWYTQAAEQGDTAAQFNLGQIYFAGVGVPKEMAKAIEWYTKAAEQGDTAAQFTLGAIYFTGDGVPKDTGKCIEWLTKAAEGGDTMAQISLGRIYGSGDGVPQNFGEAVKWYTRAANQGEAQAQFTLSGMYWRGEGVPRDSIQAYAWANIAAADVDLDEDLNAQGNQPSATKQRDLWAKLMTPGQVAEGQRISGAFKPEPEGGAGTTAGGSDHE